MPPAGCTPVELSGREVSVLQLEVSVAAGFPSPAEDHAVKRIDLNDILIRHPQATFLMRISGTSMKDAGIDDGDVVLVDRAIKPCHGHVVVAVVDGEFTVKRLWKRGDRMKLQMLGCSHHNSTVEVRERLAFSPDHETLIFSSGFVLAVALSKRTPDQVEVMMLRGPEQLIVVWNE